jgi:acyl carrier protein
MVPSAFVALDALPLTPNGKVDRKALPEPGAGRPALSGEYVAPETEVEEILAELWSRVLGVETIGIHDSFFELGGHSLKATEVLLRVRELFGVDVPVHRLFERPTIAGLAVAIADELLARAADGDVAELMAGLGTGS